MVNAGTTITFTVKGTTGEYLPRATESVRGAAVNELTPFFDVSSLSMTVGSILSDPFHSLSNWPYTAVVVARTRIAYGDIRDVDSIVAHAFYNAAGQLPTVTSAGWEASQGSTQIAGMSLTTALVLGGVLLALVLANKVL